MPVSLLATGACVFEADWHGRGCRSCRRARKPALTLHQSLPVEKTWPPPAVLTASFVTGALLRARELDLPPRA